MKKRTQRIIVIVLAAALLLSVLVPALTMLAGASGKVTEDDIRNIKNEITEIQQMKADVQNRLNSVRGDMSKAKEQISLIQSQIVLTEQEISISQSLLDQYDLDIQEKKAEVASLEDEEAEQYAEFCSHVRWLEETGSISYLSILFKAGSFSELLDYAMLISDIMEYSNGIIDALKAVQEQVREAQAALQTSRDEQAEVQKSLEAQRAELESRKLEANALYAEIAKSESALAAEAQKLANEEQQMKNDLKKAEQQYAAQIAALQNTGDWYWPLPGHYYISSIFGGRYHPIYGNWETHTGTDIPANGGTEIHSAQSGVVTSVGTNRYHSYGYYCVISHANGRSTLYAHMRSIPIVKVGQTVQKGQVIGYVGTTGSSTGNHLHFELRINGERTNALKMYPNLPYTGPYVSTIKKQLGIK